MKAEASTINNEKTHLLVRFACNLLSQKLNESLGISGRYLGKPIVVAREGRNVWEVVLTELESLTIRELVQVLDRGDGEDEGILEDTWPPTLRIVPGRRTGGKIFNC
ncbi:MAG TPA: hypothetical protein VJJ24_01665 [Candidatus Paceibacterota bacterium]